MGGWQKDLRSAEELKRTVLQMDIMTYDAVATQEMTPADLRKKQEDLYRKMNDLTGDLQLDRWEDAIPKDRKFDDNMTDDKLNDWTGGLLYRKYTAQGRQIIGQDKPKYIT